MDRCHEEALLKIKKVMLRLLNGTDKGDRENGIIAAQASELPV
jgi:hypothetical protein